MKKKDTIFIAGHKGLVGSSVLSFLKRRGFKKIITVDRKKLDLAIICGENEFKEEKLTIKKLNSLKENDQLLINRKDLVNEIKKFTKNN